MSQPFFVPLNDKTSSSVFVTPERRKRSPEARETDRINRMKRYYTNAPKKRGMTDDAALMVLLGFQNQTSSKILTECAEASKQGAVANAALANANAAVAVANAKNDESTTAVVSAVKEKDSKWFEGVSQLDSQSLHQVVRVLRKDLGFGGAEEADEPKILDDVDEPEFVVEVDAEDDSAPEEEDISNDDVISPMGFEFATNELSWKGKTCDFLYYQLPSDKVHRNSSHKDCFHYMDTLARRAKSNVKAMVFGSKMTAEADEELAHIFARALAYDKKYFDPAELEEAQRREVFQPTKLRKADLELLIESKGVKPVKGNRKVLFKQWNDEVKCLVFPLISLSEEDKRNLSLIDHFDGISDEVFPLKDKHGNRLDVSF